MADPTLADVMALLRRVELEQREQTAFLNALIIGVQLMSQVADSTKTAVDTLDTKVDQLIALIGPAVSTLRDQLAAAQTQIAALQAQIASGQPSPADAAELQATIDAAVAESAKVDAAIAALTPATPPAAR